MNEPYKIIQELESDNSRLFKEGVIVREMMAGNDEFFEGLKIALDKLYVFNIQKVDKIFGPGNDFVARAKREVFGDVGIEGMIAGPSEITVVAHKLLDISKVITSMIAQSEHGINSQSILSLIHISEPTRP